MPIYEYKCNDCQFIFEKLKSMKDIEIPVCPRCRSIHTTKQISTVKSVNDNSKGICNTRSPFT